MKKALTLGVAACLMALSGISAASDPNWTCTKGGSGGKNSCSLTVSIKKNELPWQNMWDLSDSCSNNFADSTPYPNIPTWSAVTAPEVKCATTSDLTTSYGVACINTGSTTDIKLQWTCAGSDSQYKKGWPDKTHLQRTN